MNGVVTRFFLLLAVLMPLQSLLVPNLAIAESSARATHWNFTGIDYPSSSGPMCVYSPRALGCGEYCFEDSLIELVAARLAAQKVLQDRQTSLVKDPSCDLNCRRTAEIFAGILKRVSEAKKRN